MKPQWPAHVSGTHEQTGPHVSVAPQPSGHAPHVRPIESHVAAAQQTPLDVQVVVQPVEVQRYGVQS